MGDIIEVYNRGEDITSAFIANRNKSAICDPDILKLTEIGRGVGGAVYMFGDNKATVVKRQHKEIIDGIPAYLKSCTGTERINYIDNIFKKPRVFTGYMCRSDAYTEYILGLLTTKLVDEGKSLNFIQTYALEMCTKGRRDGLYMYMEKIDENIYDIMTCRIFAKNYKGTTPQIINTIYFSIIVQIFFAILAYNKEYKIVHNDLHYRNIFFKFVKVDPDVMAYSYQIGNKKIYLPPTPFIVKIGDWDHAIKFSKPEISAHGMFDQRKYFRGNYHPNTYLPAFDVVMVLYSSFYKFYRWEELGKVYAALDDIYGGNLKSMLDSIHVKSSQYDHGKVMAIMKTQRGRTYTAEKFFENYKTPEFMKIYEKKPPKGKILSLGKL